MKKCLPLLGAALFFVNASFAQVKWNADPAHTNARFSVEHLGLSYVDGQFTKVTGTVESKSPADFTNAKISYVIDVASVDTRVEARNNHLKTDDFFNAEQFPEMKLQSVSFTHVKGNKYKLVALLTIRNITKKVTFDVTQLGKVITDPWGKTRTGFTAVATINRFDFGLKYNDKLPSGVQAVSANVQIVVNTELVKE